MLRINLRAMNVAGSRTSDILASVTECLEHNHDVDTRRKTGDPTVAEFQNAQPDRGQLLLLAELVLGPGAKKFSLPLRKGSALERFLAGNNCGTDVSDILLREI